MRDRQIARFAVLGLLGLYGCGGGGGGGAGDGGGGGGGATGHTLTVSVRGLRDAEQITLTLNGSRILTVSGEGQHTFPGTYASGSSYRIAISNVPVGVSCSSAPEAGQVTGNVTVNVTCGIDGSQVQQVADVNGRWSDRSSTPRSVVRFGNRVAFSALGAGDRQRMYLTDGTASGTVDLTDLRNPLPFAAFGELLLFYTTSERRDRAYLHATRGVPGDAQSLAEVAPNSEAVDIGRRMLFYGFVNYGPHGREPWVTDGTPSGTRMVMDIRPGSESSGLGPIVPMEGYGYFVADDGTGQKLWRSNGTAAGTERVSAASRYVSAVIGAHAGRIYFMARATDGFNYAVWMTDGTPDTEALAADFDPDGDDHVSCLTSIGSTMYFTAWSPETSVWAADSDMSSRRQILAPPVYDACGFQAFGGDVYFVSGPENDATVWRTDGTAAGTHAVAHDVARSYPTLLLPVGDRLIFPRTTRDEGTELWSTDGNDVTLVLDARPGPASGVNRISGGVSTGQFAFVPLDDGLTGLEPWATDGTAPGTRPLGNLAREVSTGDGVVELLGYTSQGVFFTGCKADNDCELWITNGTAAGTREVVDLGADSTSPSGAVTVNDRLVFRNRLGGPWVSDGTAAGTARIGSSDFGSPSRHNREVVLFTGLAEGGTGTALWRTDGTQAGTYQVAVIGLEFGRSNLFTPFQGSTFFRGNRPRGLYRTDGTAAGTVLVAPVDIAFGHPLPTMAAAGDSALLFTGRDAEAGDEPWRSDGTSAGTGRLIDLYPGRLTSAADQYVAFRDEVYFRARDAGNEGGLWASDGSGVRLVLSFPGDLSESPGGLVAADDALYFRAQSQLWKSDGTGPGTVALPLRREGFAGNPIQITPIDGGVFFFASTGASYSPFFADGEVITQLSDQVQVDNHRPLYVPSGPFAGVYFVGRDESGGRELWVYRPGR